ncbi:MAG: autotransporter-associated beta strand repeat-containing protein, partial [Kiritimatiellia bacterium]|nr:autotransporter-associated beta strand repeat-containing protein [Kiritimatiellia bacterium]
MKNRLIGLIWMTALALPGFVSADSAVTIYYWDLNGSTAGFGNLPRDGVWNLANPNWTTASGGSITTFAWPGDVYPSDLPDIARFQTGSGTVIVEGTQTVAAVQFTSDASYTLTGGVIRIQSDNAAGFGSDQTVANNTVLNLYTTLMLGTPTNAALPATRVGMIRNGALATTGTNQMTLHGLLTAEAGIATGQAVWLIRSSKTLAENFYQSDSRIVLADTSVIENGGITVNVEYGSRRVEGYSGRIDIYSTNSTYTGESRFTGGAVVLYQSALNNQAGPLGNASSALRLGYGNLFGEGSSLAILNGVAGITMARAIQVDNGGNAATNTANFDVVLGSLHTSGTSTFSGAVSMGSSSAFDALRGERTAPVDLLASGDSTVIFSGPFTSNLNSTNTPLRKIGAGTAILSHVGNSFSGGTIVSEGTLLVNGGLTGTGAVTVASGATLGGTGVITGHTTVDGTLSPGTSVGELTFEGNLTLGSGSTSAFEINGLLAGQYDQVLLSVSGKHLTYGGTLELDIWSGAQVGDF